MKAKLKSAILNNRFADILRMEQRIDSESFKDLCKALKQLRNEWRGQTTVDREIVADLVCQLTVIRNMGDRFGSAGKIEDEQDVRDKWSKLDDLVASCLTD